MRETARADLPPHGKHDDMGEGLRILARLIAKVHVGKLAAEGQRDQEEFEEDNRGQ